MLLGLSWFDSKSNADTFLQSSLPVSECGYVDQYDPTIYSKYNDEACLPTSEANALIFLENSHSALLGSSLTSGTTYTNYLNTVLSLGADDATSPSSGTGVVMGADGLYNYLHTIAPTVTLNQSGYYSSDLYGTDPYGLPSIVTYGDTGAANIYTDLSNQDALYLGITYTTSRGVADGGGGHAIFIDGINWDSTVNTGTLSFIDPLDPGANSASTTGGYVNGIASSPVITTGTLALDPQNSKLLLLAYNQYDGGSYTNGLPPSADYKTVYTVIGFSETVSLGVVPEPSTWAMMAAGTGGMIVLRSR